MDEEPLEGERVSPEDVEKPFVEAETFGTFGGVFTPTILTILGVIMYLRLGWVVGNAGFLAAVGIILLAFGIILATGLSMSSITTNIRMGAGGAYSIISQSLGIEVGGSIGIPLYISQALAVSMYIFGFREGWQYVFPHHPAILVDLAVFATLFIIALVSSSLAFRVQYVIMGVIAASLVSVIVAGIMGSMTEPITWFGSFPGAPEDGFQGTSFWVVFAVFFPAATGIMAGANMSGDLEDPRRSIPKGTLWAIGLSLIIYLSLAYWLARTATVDELVSNYTIMIDRAAWGPAVVAGLLGATFSSALATLVGAPRILEALGVHRIIPRGEWLAERSAAGEPTKALVFTGGIILAALMLRDLNAVAPLITMFFLITYGMINVVVLVEQRLALISFRPLMRIPTIVPLLGALGCITVMFIVNAAVGVAAIILVAFLYTYLVRQQLEAPYGDVRSGLFLSLTEWGAKRVDTLRGPQDRAWRPNLLVPVRDPDAVKRDFHMLRNLVHPKGSLNILGVAGIGGSADLAERLEDVRNAFREEDLSVNSTALGASSFPQGVVDAMQTFQAAFFRPNTLFLPVPTDEEQASDARSILERTPRSGLGAMLYREHPRAGLGRRRRVTLWLTAESGWSLDVEDLGNLDLAVLTAIQLQRNWNATIRLMAVVEDESEVATATAFLDGLADLARIPRVAGAEVRVGSLPGVLEDAPPTDINVVPLPGDRDLQALAEAADTSGASCIFTQDGGGENAFA